MLFLALVLVAGCGRSEAPQANLRANSTPPQAAGEEAVVPGVASQPDATASDMTPIATESSEATSAKVERAPIYDPSADGKALIAAAIERAARNDKHVLIEWGGNWCGWCYKLHDVFTNDAEVKPIVFEQYELVLVDEGTNLDLMRSYGGQDRKYSFPHLTILDAKGEVVVNQNTEPLEEGPKHVPSRVAEFLKKWAPTPADAEERLAAALQTATAEDKRVLVHVGTPYCGWCRILSDFLHEHETLFARDYIDLKIDTMRMTAGEPVAKRFQPAGSLGVPWMVILDKSGKVLANSVGPEGNCGYPFTPPEIDHFLNMLKSTAQRLTAAELAEIRGHLDDYRVQRDERQKAEAAKAITTTAGG